MTDITTTRSSGIRVFAVMIVVAAVAGLTLAPPSIAAPARRLFVHAVVVFAEPVVLWLPGGLTERVLNTLLFVPLGATVALLLSRRLWPVAIVAGLALSATVEFVQASIPGRVPDLADVLWNTVGAAIGVALITLPRVVAAAARRPRGSTRRTAPAVPVQNSGERRQRPESILEDSRAIRARVCGSQELRTPIADGAPHRSVATVTPAGSRAPAGRPRRER